jgi:hypothetical protein
MMRKDAKYEKMVIMGDVELPVVICWLKTVGVETGSILSPS